METATVYELTRKNSPYNKYVKWRLLIKTPLLTRSEWFKTEKAANEFIAARADK